MSSVNGTVEETAPAERGTVTNDPELVAIARIAKELNKLDATSRDRVVRYLNEKFS